MPHKAKPIGRWGRKATGLVGLPEKFELPCYGKAQSSEEGWRSGLFGPSPSRAMWHLTLMGRQAIMTRILINPGEHLADVLKALGMRANGLAKELGVPTNRITEIIRGKRRISGDTALSLGRWSGTGPPRPWKTGQKWKLPGLRHEDDL